MTPVEKLINTAKNEIGYLEKRTNNMLESKTANAGENNWTKYAKHLDLLGIYNTKKNGYSWCAIFVDWCFVTAFGLDIAMGMTYQPITGGYGASCTSSLNYYKTVGMFYKNNPQPGDQIFFKNKKGDICHTGIVVKVDSNKVYTIEGNTSSDEGVVDNGGSVNNKSYPINYKYIAGYGRPNYSLVKIEEDDEDMDIQKFKELYAEMRKEWQDNDKSQFSKEACDWAIQNGLIQGGGTTNGQPNYMYQDQISREQMLTILYRFAKLIGRA